MKKLIFLAAISATAAHAADTGIVSITQTVTDAIQLAGAAKIMPMAISWLGAFMGLQFVLTNIGVLKSGGDLEAVWAKLMGSILWFGFCWYLLQNGPDFIDAVGGGILEKFAGFPKPGWIITTTLLLCTPFLAAIAAVGIVNTGLSLVILSAMFTVLGVGMMLALKIMMLTIELGLIVMLSPLSFSLLGLNALKGQGIAPLKSLLSLVYRIVLLSVICVAFTELVTVAAQNIKGIGDPIEWLNPLNWPGIINTILSTVIAFPVIGYLVFKTDSIAATLAGGASNMGTADVSAAGAQGSATRDAARDGSAATMASKPVQSMTSFMSALGASTSVKNGSSDGNGMGSTGSNPPPMALASKMDTQPAPANPESATSFSPTQSQSEQLSPQAKNSLGVEDAAKAAGASPAAAGAGAESAYNGGSPEQISSAVMSAGGTAQQGAAAAAASTTAGPPAWKQGVGTGASLIGAAAAAAQNQTAPQKSVGDSLKKASDLFASEKAATHVSIDTHHSD